MEKLKEALTKKLRLVFGATMFLMITTLISVILLYVPTFLSSSISIPITSLGSIILGSIFGQFTLLIALNATNKITEKGQELLQGIEDLETKN